MGADSIVNNDEELRNRVAWVIKHYRQPALVEEYLPGREFTIAVMGRQDARQYSRHPEFYGPDGFVHFAPLEIDNNGSITPGVYGNAAKTLHFGDEGIPGFACPADVTPELGDQLHNLAVQAHLALNSVDVSRVDFRMDARGNLRLLEINTLPGLTPDFSDLCVIGNATGISYQDLILEILYLGASRFGLLQVAEVESLRVHERPFALTQMVRVMPFGNRPLLD
jgi:D-alanine-D-alanine ligase